MRPASLISAIAFGGEIETPHIDRQCAQGYAPQRKDFHTTDVAKRHPQVVARLAAAYDEWLKRVKPGSE